MIDFNYVIRIAPNLLSQQYYHNFANFSIKTQITIFLSSFTNILFVNCANHFQKLTNKLLSC